ncbi:unnamed protein product, partial [marine sediment metagenome]
MTKANPTSLVSHISIEVTDPLAPSRGDYYAITKISAEKLIRESDVDFAIFRLT